MVWEIIQCLQILDTTSVTKNWSRLVLYSDLCVQTVRRALTHLVYTFDAELRTLTKKGGQIFLGDILTGEKNVFISHKHAAISLFL